MATYSGTIDLRVTGNAEEKAEKIKRSVEALRDLAKSLKPIPNLFDNRTQDKDIRKAKEELRSLVEQYGKGTGAGRRFSNTIAGLNGQLNAFNRVIGNVNVGSAEFVQSLTASEKVSRRLARAEAERLSVLNQINTANTVGQATSVKETLDLGKVVPKSVAGLELYQQELKQLQSNVTLASEDFVRLGEEIERVNAMLGRAPSGPSSPIGGGRRFPGSPGALAAEARDQANQRRRRRTDVLTGAGFPLLFGGGPLQSLAGGIGGAVGGLGGSIIASAVVSQVEAFAKAVAEVGVALTSTSGTLEFMREKALFSSPAVADLAAEYEKTGEVGKLAALITGDLAKQIGNQGVEALKSLGETTKETTRLWNLLTTQLFTLVSGPLEQFLKIVNQVLGGITGRITTERFRQDLGDEARARFDKRVRELEFGDRTGLTPQERRRGKKGVGALGADAARQQAMREFGGEITRPTGTVTLQDRRDFAISGGRKKKDKTPGLRAEVALQERLFVLNRGIAQAAAEKNTTVEAALKMDVEMERLAAKVAQIKASDLDADDKQLKIRIATLQAEDKIAQILERKKAAEATRAKAAAKTIADLQDEQNLLQATLDGRKGEEELKQRIADATRDMTESEASKAEAILRANELLKEQVRVQDQMKEIYGQIGMSIKTGVVDAIQSAIDGTKSLGEVAANVLRDMSNKLLDIGLNLALFGVTSGTGTGGGLFGGFFANGGRPPVGKASIVGEKGPELFVPGTAGTIVPNSALGGGTANIVVNVDASGTNVGGDQDEAKRLGQAVAVAVQQELVRQKRPGGLLA